MGAGHVTYPKDDVVHWEPGFSLGRPLARDKAWFFASYNPSFQTQDRSVTLTADDSVVSRRHRRTMHNALANVSSQIGSRTRARVAFNSRKWVWDGALPTLDGSDDPRTHYAYKEIWPNWSLSGNAPLTGHRLRNLLSKAPARLREELSEDYRRMVYAETAAAVNKARAAFLRKWKLRCPGSQWKALRITNALERIKEEFRRRTKTQSSLASSDAVVLLLFGLLRSGAMRLRIIDGAKHMSKAVTKAA